MALKTLNLTVIGLVLGDAVRLLEEPYGWGTVVKITGEEVHIKRPYTHIGDVRFGGSEGSRYVLDYIGQETVKVWLYSDRVLTVDAYTHERMSQEGALK